MKIRPVGAELFNADGRTDRHEANYRTRLHYVHILFKVAPLQAWTAPEGSRKLRLPDNMTTAQDGGMFVSLTHRPPLPPGNTPSTHFC